MINMSLKERLRQVTQSLSIPVLSPELRYLKDEEELVSAVDSLKTVGLKVVLTMGTFDMMHIGHSRYLREARLSGDVLILGLDDDAKTKKRKGEYRPVVPENERCEMAAHVRYVDLVYIKRADGERWGMIKLVKPDVLIAVEGTYRDEELAELAQYCGEVKVLPRQAETSTSAKVRRLVIGGNEQFMKRLAERLPEAIKQIFDEMRGDGD